MSFWRQRLISGKFPPKVQPGLAIPAPFPVGLPKRLIELYTYKDDVVLDPFMGSGTSAVAAIRTGRHFLGFETDGSYVKIAKKRISEERKRMAKLEEMAISLPRVHLPPCLEP